MSVPGEKFVDRLVPVLATADLVAAYELLDGLAGDELAEATTWFASAKRWVRNLYEHVAFDRTPRDGDADHLAVTGDARWIVSMCAVRLCGPRTAATRADWTEHWDFRGDRGEAAFVHLLWDQDPAWVAEFVDAASRVRLGGRARNCNETLSRVLRAAVVHHGLAAPAGDTFLKEWRAGTPVARSWVRRTARTPLVEWLQLDPLMPAVLWHYLGSGHCGDEEAELPDAVAELTAAGVVDRDTLVETVLVALTAGQPPTAQRVLAKIVAAIGLRAEEVRGGVPYLSGVLATADRSVPPMLLPLALELVADGPELRGLADVVAARPEQKPRAQLLSALRKAELRERVGDDAVADVLDVLALTDDAAYAAKVEALRTKLGLGPRQVVGDQTLGLWDLAPTSSGTEYGDTWWHIDELWEGLLDPVHAESRRWRVAEVVDRELYVMGQGSYDPVRMIRAVQKVRGGPCHVGELGSALEELFLGGGLRASWAAALECAGLCADPGAPAARRPTGVADLLRVLSRYAGEAPGPHAVPPGLAALAADASSSKAAVEARRLVTLLTGEDEETVVRRLRAAATPPDVEHRGLWGLMSDESIVLPEAVPARLASDPMAALRRVVPLHWSHTGPLGDIWSPAPCPTASRAPVGLVDSDVLLGTVLAALPCAGTDAVRGVFTDLDQRRAVDEIAAALECWLDAAVDVAVFWRLATAEVASWLQVAERWRAGPRAHQVRAWAAGLSSFAERLREPDDPEAGVLVVPLDLATPGQRFLFLRAAEALLRAPDSSVLLGLPSWRDGTVDLDDLLARLRRAAATADGVVGPLDLVVALHRLREVDPARADEVPDGLRTDPRFTTESGTETWDATALVRRWIALGGLPRLRPVPRDGAWTGAPTTPVPYPSLAAWPAELADDPWSPTVVAYDRSSSFRAETVLRLYPRWSDRAIFEAHPVGWGGVPALATGPLGLAVHDVLLSQLTPAGATNGVPNTFSFLQQVRFGRIDPARAAAAAVGRHEAGTLGLTGLVRTMSTAMETHLRGLWPIVLAIADALCGVPRRPAALADLLRLLASYAHEVPGERRTELPAAISALAEGRGSGKAQLAARDLVAAWQGSSAG